MTRQLAQDALRYVSRTCRDATVTLPAWIVLTGGNPRWIFRRFKIIAGPTMCKVSLRPEKKPRDNT